MTTTTGMIRTYSTERFTCDQGVLVAEDSDFTDGTTRGIVLGRVWPDSCDVGFDLRSHKTGQVERFYLNGEDKDREGDIAGWHFEPVNRQLRGRVRVLVIND
jgi:hypothetical protein